MRSLSSVPSIMKLLPCRIWPLTSVCSELEALKNCECCSATGATPGARFSRLWKLRFELISGTLASTVRSIFWPVDALSVCSMGGAPVTSTVSVMEPGCNCTSTRTKRKLVLKLYDNQSDVNLSVRQYTQLVSQDKVNLLLGPFASNFALADSAVSEKYRIPMVQGGGASDQIFSRGFKYIFGTLAPATNYFAARSRCSSIEPDAEDRRPALRR